MYRIYILVLTFGVVHAQYMSMIGPGLWNILSIKHYDPMEGDELCVNCEVVKRRLNRTHEGYNIACHFEKDFVESYGLILDMCKKVDGGCKPFQKLTDESVTRFIEKYTNENLKNLLESAGVDPPEFPVPAGSYKVENYIIDYCNLPPNCAYGEYEATACVLKGSQRIWCIGAMVEFVQDEKDVCGY